MHRVDGRQFARSLTVSGPRFAWLLGAGASAAAGIPTGYAMILDFKTTLFCSATGIPRREIDPGDPIWAERITEYFDGTHGFPPKGDPSEYAVAFETVYPDRRERWRYIARHIERGDPTYGHKVLASLVVSGQLPCVATTNFDTLAEDAVTVADSLLPVDQRARLVVADRDSAERARTCIEEAGWPLLVKLHGDYRSTHLMNTPAELRAQDEDLRRVLVEVLNRFGLVVVGYSGRDESVMRALADALEGQSPFPAGIRWVRSDREPLQAVLEFLDHAASRGVDARFVEAETFDELAADVATQADLPAQLVEHIRGAGDRSVVRPVVLSERTEAATFPVLRCSALPVLDMPETARRIRVNQPVTSREARLALKKSGVRGVVAARGHEVVAFGADGDLLRAFRSWGAELDGVRDLDPRADSSARGLIHDALARSLSRRRPIWTMLRGSGHALVVRSPKPGQHAEVREPDQQQLRSLAEAYKSPLVGTVPDVGFPFAEAIWIRLECHDGRWWCVFDPFTWVDYPKTDQPTGHYASPRVSTTRRGDVTSEWRNERWAQRYNRQWAHILNEWSQLLVQGDPTETLQAFGFGPHLGIDAVFTLHRLTAWSSPSRLPR